MRTWLLLGLLLASAAAQSEPLWDVGIGLASLSAPDYRGAKSRSQYALPFPYFIYRGERVQVDERKGMRGVLARFGALELDISLSGSLPVNSDHASRRNGMADLEPTFEIGPSLEFPLYLDPATDSRLEFQWPVRAVYSTDFAHIDHQGWLTNPRLDYVRYYPMRTGRLKLNLTLGALFANEAYHAYYYDVPAQDATASRPAYHAEGGYSGSRLYLSVSRHFDHRARLGGFVMIDRLQGASFAASPLLETERAVYGGVFASWILFSSTRQAAPSSH